MNNVTNIKFEDLFKILPLEEVDRKELEENFDGYDQDRKFNIKRILWDVFHKMTDELAGIKLQELELEIQEGKRKITPDLYQQARAFVMQDYRDILNGKKQDDEQIDKIRDQLKNLMSN